MATIHHAITKRAAKFGCTIVETPEGGFKATKGNKLSLDSYDTAKECCDNIAAGTIEWETRVSGFCGVMVAAYHDRYEHNAHGPGSCDGLDCALRDEYTTDEGVNRPGLLALALKLDLYNPAWEALNNGMVRMNLSNRIRAWLRNNADAALTIGGVTGRFGVPFRPAGKAARKMAAMAKAA